MEVKRNIQIDGIDYTNKLINVSDIDIGVRGLGFGYVSDITVELVFDSSLTNCIGKTAIIILQVNERSYIYEGIIEKVFIKNETVSLNIRHILSIKKFLPLPIRYFPDIRESLKIPVIYGSGQYDLIDFNAIAVYSTKGADGRRIYSFLVGDKPLVESREFSSGVFVFDAPIWEETAYGRETHPWFELIESNPSSEYRRYKFNINYNLEEKIMNISPVTGDMSFFAGKRQGDGTILYTQITIDQNTGLGFISDIYDELKIQHHTSISYVTGDWKTELWRNQNLSESYKPQKYFRSRIDTTRTQAIDSPVDIIYDILKKNNFSVRKKVYPSSSARCNFRTTDDYINIIQKVAEAGSLYVVPTMNNSFDILPAGFDLSPKATLSVNDFIERSFSISEREADFTKLKVLWSSPIFGGQVSYYGEGDREKEYKAEYLVRGTDVDIFANNYLSYYQKQKYISFETPLYPDYLDIDVGDVVTINYSRYSINQNFQIIEKSIRNERIRFKCKEV